MLVLSVVVLFAANMSVIIMSLEFGRRPTKKFLKFGISVALYGYNYKLAFHHPLVRWKYMSSGYCTKLGTEHCSIIRIVVCGTTFTLLKKRCQCFVDAPMLRSHRRQRPLTDNKEKPQPHCSGICMQRLWRFGCKLCNHWLTSMRQNGRHTLNGRVT